MKFKIGLESIHNTDKKSNFTIQDIDLSLEKDEFTRIIHLVNNDLDFGIPISDKIKIYTTPTGFSFRNMPSQSVLRITISGDDSTQLLKQIQQSHKDALLLFTGDILNGARAGKILLTSNKPVKKIKLSEPSTPKPTSRGIICTKAALVSDSITSNTDRYLPTPNPITPLGQSLMNSMNRNSKEVRQTSDQGFLNLGQTCYMSAVMQAFLNTRLFGRIMTAFKHIKSLNLESNESLVLLKLLYELVENKRQGISLEIDKVRNYLLQVAPQFTPFVQQVNKLIRIPMNS